MSRVNTDRNLLIGVLALQMDFIDRNQLVAVMQAWITEKSRSLDQLLLEHNALSEDTRLLLVGLVDKHLEMHGGDVEQSLAAASSLRSARDALAQLDDVDLEASLIHVGEKHHDEDPSKTLTHVATGEFTSKGQRFRVLRPHAAGGLGKVSVAHDEELSREVALKEIKEKFADNLENRSRFIVEAEITGGLEHPGIVPVYGLGQYADGRPFYAMRFIRGDSLKQAIAHYHKQDSARQNLGQRSLDLCKLLGRFIDVCYAIEYAHSRGVLHRDLKPGNIMLGKYGETLVVDWGLAKTTTQDANERNLHEPPLRPASASGSAATRAGSQLGTPAYMSPEQAAGRLDLLNTSSDVYSLGATLYELLTGEAPFAGRRIEDLLRNVEKGDFPKPRSIKQGIPPALEAIVLKAMALQQADRYPSAATLAEDVESWLADEPVTAWQEPLSVRAGRWMRRHRTWVSSAAAALVATVAILTVSMVLVLAAKNEADRQKKRAEDNLQVAMQAVHEMLTQVGSEDLADVPQMEEVRTRLLAKAKEFFEQLGKQEPTDRRLRFEIALASQGIGDVHRIAGEMQLATAKYEDAIARLEKLNQEFPNDSEYQRQLANSFNFLGVSLKPTDRARAISEYEKAIELQEDLLRRSPGDPVLALELVRSIYNRGIARSESGDDKKAEGDYRSARDRLKTLISKKKGSETHLDACRQELARCYNNLANLLKVEALDILKTTGQHDKAKFDESQRMYEMAIETLTLVQERDVESREFMKELAQYHNNFANFFEKLKDLEAARTHNDEALRLLEELAKAVPKVRDELGNTLNTQAAVIGELSKGAEGSVSARRSEELFRKLFEDHPNNLSYQHRLGNALYTQAILKYRQEDFLAAKPLLAESLAHHVLVLTKMPDDPGFLPNFDNDCFMLALVLKKLHQPDEELKELEKVKATRALQIKKALLYAARLLGEAVGDAESDNNVNESSSETTANRLAELTLILLETAARNGQISLQQLSEVTDEGGAFFHVKDRDGFSRIKALLENDRKVIPQN